MDENTQQEEKTGGIQGEGRMTQGWSVTDEEIDRVIKKLEEGWGW